MKKVNYIFLVLLFQILPFMSLGQFNLQTDSLALVALYNSTDGNNWTDKTNWLTGNVDNWYGIEIANSRVTKIALPYNNLAGSIPTEIGNLTKLEYLNLHGNNING